MINIVKALLLKKETMSDSNKMQLDFKNFYKVSSLSTAQAFNVWDCFNKTELWLWSQDGKSKSWSLYFSQLLLERKIG